MSFLAVVGIILVAVGLLGLFKVLSISMAIAIALCVVGLICLFLGRDLFVRRP